MPLVRHTPSSGAAHSKDSKQNKPPRDLGQELYDWAENEMKFMPQGRYTGHKPPSVDVFRKLCRGRGCEYWDYIVQHVRSAETVNQVRMNLALNHATGESEEAQRIRRHHELITQRDLLRSKVEKQRTDLEKVQSELQNSENELNRLEANHQSQLRQLDDSHQRKLLLSAFAKKCGQDAKKINNYEDRISVQLDKYKHIISSGDTSQYYNRPKSIADDSGLESACTKDVREACDLIAKYLTDKPTDKPNSKHQEVIGEKLTKVMSSYPSTQILSSIIEVTNEAALDIKLQTQRINISDDVKKLQFKQQMDGDLIDLNAQTQRGVDDLIERCRLEHVLRFATIQKTKNSIHNLEKQLDKTRQDCELTLQQNLGGLPDLLELTKMVLEAGVKLSGLQSGLKCLQKFDNEFTQKHARIEMDKATLQQKYQRIQDFDQIADGKQNLIKALVRQSRSTKTRLHEQKHEILAYIGQSFRKDSNELRGLMQKLKGGILNEARIFSTISVSHLPIVVLSNMERLSRLELSINRFRPELVPQHEEMISALEKLEFPFHQAPELLVERCMELQTVLADYQRRSTTRELPECARTSSKMTDVLTKVDRHDQSIRERILPKMVRCLVKTNESLADCLYLKNSVDAWWEQPGQYVTPWVKVDGKTFQEYKDQWTILCTRLRQLQCA